MHEYLPRLFTQICRNLKVKENLAEACYLKGNGITTLIQWIGKTHVTNV